jgi:hypothetical protein
MVLTTKSIDDDVAVTGRGKGKDRRRQDDESGMDVQVRYRDIPRRETNSIGPVA